MTTEAKRRFDDKVEKARIKSGGPSRHWIADSAHETDNLTTGLAWTAYFLLVMLALLVASITYMVFFSEAAHGQELPPTRASDTQCFIPNIVHLGDGPGVYTLPDGFQDGRLLEKRSRRGELSFEYAALDASGTMTTTRRNSAVYALKSFTSTVPAAFEGDIMLGDGRDFQEGYLVEILVIDDQDDDRPTTVSDANGVIMEVIHPQMVHLVSVVARTTGPITINARDSIGAFSVCASPPPTGIGPTNPGEPGITRIYLPLVSK